MVSYAPRPMIDGSLMIVILLKDSVDGFNFMFIVIMMIMIERFNRIA